MTLKKMGLKHAKLVQMNSCVEDGEGVGGEVGFKVSFGVKIDR